MKKYLLLLGALALFAACEGPAVEDPKDDENQEQVEPKPEVFSMSLVEKSVGDIVVDVDMGDFEGNYFIGVVGAEVYPDAAPEEIAEAMSDWWLNTADMSFASADNKFVFDRSREVSLAERWQINKNHQYDIVAFGVDKTGEILTDVAHLDVTTDDVEIEGSVPFEVTTLEAKSIKIKTEPSEEIGLYLVGLIDIEVYKSTFEANPDKAASSVINILIMNKQDLSVPGIAVYEGAGEVNLGNVWTIESVTKYIILAFGIDEYGNVSSEIVTKEVTTPSIGVEDTYKGDGLIKFENIAATTDDISFSTVVDDSVNLYYVASCSVANFESYYGNDYEYLASDCLTNAVKYYGVDLSKPNNIDVFKGSQDQINLKGVWTIEANKDHKVFAFGYDPDTKALTTKVSHITVFTGDSSAAAPSLLAQNESVVSAAPAARSLFFNASANLRITNNYKMVQIKK